MIEGATRERFAPASLPWNVRFALAAHDAGWTLPDHLLMAVQMIRNGEGCASCRRAVLDR
jgi:hypothetical protein